MSAAQQVTFWKLKNGKAEPEPESTVGNRLLAMSALGLSPLAECYMSPETFGQWIPSNKTVIDQVADNITTSLKDSQKPKDV